MIITQQVKSRLEATLGGFSSKRRLQRCNLGINAGDLWPALGMVTVH